MKNSIIIFWLRTDGTAGHIDMSEHGLTKALSYAEGQRKLGARHVTISTENPDNVGKPGVDSLVDGKTPDGHDYEWSKAGRAGKMRKRDEDRTPRNGADE